MGIAGNEWGFQVGTLPKGARDKISDVPGVTVGHCTLADGVVQTGVTAMSSTALARPPAWFRSTSWARWKRPSCLPTPSAWARHRPRW